jgi:hypothetical protein
MRKMITIAVLLLCAAGMAQQVPNVNPGEPVSEIPTVTFSQSWADAVPPYYSIAVSNDGRVAYHSTPKAENQGEPYDLKFVMSDVNLAKVLRLTKELNFFNGNFDYKKSKIAFTGTKLLRYEEGKRLHETSYNWSDNVRVQELTTLFQGISETVELGRLVSEKYKFDKLGVDAELKKLESAAKSGRLEEVGAIQPILSKIAKDSSMMNISRRRAEFLLSRALNKVHSGGQP